MREGWLPRWWCADGYHSFCAVVVVSANTLFCTEKHDELIARCADGGAAAPTSTASHRRPALPPVGAQHCLPWEPALRAPPLPPLPRRISPDPRFERHVAVLSPGGLLLFDVYNALPWHDEAMEAEGAAGAGEEGGKEEEKEVGDLLVKVRDESGREWSDRSKTRTPSLPLSRQARRRCVRSGERKSGVRIPDRQTDR